MSQGALAELRQATCIAHEQLEDLPYAHAARDGTLPLGHYTAFLRAMRLTHEELGRSRRWPASCAAHAARS